MKQAISLLFLALLCAGCGSNFEWFPKNGTFQNNSTAAPAPPPPATINNSISFPNGVTWISDLAYDKNSSSFWLLAGTSTAPNVLVKFGLTTKLILEEAALDATLSNIVDGSSMAFDGSSLWITSNAYSGGVPVSEIYQVWPSGILQKTYPCPATPTGFCQGLVWDSTTSSFWVAGSDNKNLVNFKIVSGAVTTVNTYLNLWSTNGVSDIGFDTAANQLLVLKDGMIPVNAASGSVGTRKSFIIPGAGRGDWDGSYFWVIDNTEKKLKAVVVN